MGKGRPPAGSKADGSMKPNTCLHQVPMLRMSGAMPLLPHTLSCRGAYLSARNFPQVFVTAKRLDLLNFIPLTSHDIANHKSV
jgi:hypothetical protein